MNAGKAKGSWAMLGILPCWPSTSRRRLACRTSGVILERSVPRDSIVVYVDRNDRMPSVLDVVDNYLSMRHDDDFSSISGRDIEAFGDRMREFAAAHEPLIDENLHPIYLGGWPSANFALIGGDFILSSLLYSGQVLVRDPVADWFSDEQYRIEHMLGTSPGYHPPDESAEARTRRTRAFLKTVLPHLQKMRPLIDAGLVVPVATERLFFERRASIDKLRRDVTAKLTIDTKEYTERFKAHEIATENNRRGFFPFAPGPEPIPQIEGAIGHGVRYFAREYTLATAHSVTYTAPFAHEQFLCRSGISPAVGSSTRVVEAILQSDLPIYTGLTPEIIRRVHDDDTFAGFRATLHEVYQGTPLDNQAEATMYIRDQENALLKPHIDQAIQASQGGFLSRLGTAVSNNRYGIGTALAADFTLGTEGIATAAAVVGVVSDELRRARKASGPIRIWNSLVRHTSTIESELKAVRTDLTPAAPFWGIPPEPAMSVAVSSGQMIFDADPRSVQALVVDEDTKLKLGVYRPCECGSGRKFRFCCSGVG